MAGGDGDRTGGGIVPTRRQQANKDGFAQHAQDQSRRQQLVGIDVPRRPVHGQGAKEKGQRYGGVVIAILVRRHAQTFDEQKREFGDDGEQSAQHQGHDQGVGHERPIAQQGIVASENSARAQGVAIRLDQGFGQQHEVGAPAKPDMHVAAHHWTDGGRQGDGHTI